MNDQAGAFSEYGKILGSFDSDSSSIIVNNLGTNVAPMTVGTLFTPDEEEMSVAINLLILVDSSGSMDCVRQSVIDGINKILIPSLRGTNAQEQAAIRVNGVAFNTKSYPLWHGGWRSLDASDLPEVTSASYTPDGLTYLRDSIISAVSILCGRAAEVIEQTGTPPKNILVVISDGADRGSTATIAEVKKIIEALDPQMFTLGFIFFETWEDIDGKAMASELGFPNALDIKANPRETQADIERRFRAAFSLTSQSIVGKVQSLSTGMINQSGVGLFD